MDVRIKRLLILIAFGSALRLVLAAVFPLGNDEAYHTLFLQHPQASYFDHPPMLMWVQYLGMTLFGQTAETVTPFAARFGFVLLFAGSTVMVFRMTSRWFGRNAGFLAAFALNLSAYHSVAVGTFILPDAPLLFFWLLTMDRLSLALEANEQGDSATRLWLQVGLVWGLAMLSKYHAVFLPLAALIYLLLRPTCRKKILSLGPWLAVVLGLLIFSPVIWWNSQNQWASFLFQSGRAMGGGFNPVTLLGAIGGQVAYLTPWVWLPAVSSLLLLIRRSQSVQTDQESGLNIRLFLLCCSLPALLIFLMVASRRQVLPHWSLVGLIAMFPMVGRSWNLTLNDPLKHFRMIRQLRFGTGFLIIAAVFVSVHSQMGLVPWRLFGKTGEKIARVDMTLDELFWTDLTNQMKAKGWMPEPGGFVFTGRWYESGHLARSFGPEVKVLCYNVKDSRGFADWSSPENVVGQDGILVSVSASPEIEPACFERWFDRIEPLGVVDVSSQGVVFKQARVFRCVRQKMVFPYDRRLDITKGSRMIAIDAPQKSKIR